MMKKGLLCAVAVMAVASVANAAVVMDLHFSDALGNHLGYEYTMGPTDVVYIQLDIVTDVVLNGAAIMYDILEEGGTDNFTVAPKLIANNIPIPGNPSTGGWYDSGATPLPAVSSDFGLYYSVESDVWFSESAFAMPLEWYEIHCSGPSVDTLMILVDDGAPPPLTRATGFLDAGGAPIGIDWVNSNVSITLNTTRGVNC